MIVSHVQSVLRLQRIVLSCVIATAVVGQSTYLALGEDGPPDLPDVDISDSIEGGAAPLFGNGDGAGIFRGGGGGLFGGGRQAGGGGPFGNLNPRELMANLRFMMMLMALFQGSNTQQSAGTAIQNLQNANSQGYRQTGGANNGGANGTFGPVSRDTSPSRSGNGLADPSSSSRTGDSSSTGKFPSIPSGRESGQRNPNTSNDSGPTTGGPVAPNVPSQGGQPPSQSDGSGLPFGSFFPKDFGKQF